MLKKYKAVIKFWMDDRDEVVNFKLKTEFETNLYHSSFKVEEDLERVSVDKKESKND